MDYLVKILDIIIWPLVVLIFLWVARNPIKQLLLIVESIKYKDVEVKFGKLLEQVKDDIGEIPLDVLADKENKSEIYALIEVSASSAIIEAWKSLENAAKNKIKDLIPAKEKFKNATNRPLDYLEYLGALIPSTCRAIKEMRQLRNQSVRITDKVITKENAINYIQIAETIRKQIEGITDLPKIKLTALTILILELNHLIDSGKYNDISIEEVYKHIGSQNIIPFLIERTKEDSDFSFYREGGSYHNFTKLYHEQMENLYNCYSGDHRKKWGVEKLGLCLLLAWTNELIQGGKGWYPAEF